MHIRYNQKLYLMCIFAFYIMYKRCYNKNNNKVETLSTLKSKNKQQEEKTMRIHEMHEAYVKRNWEQVKQHNENLDELKMRITEVVTSFKEAADKIPEDVIYRAIDSVMGSEEDDCFYDCWMLFSIENDEISYDLGDNVAGKVQDDETIKEVHKLTQFFYREYWRKILFKSFWFEIDTFKAKLVFVSHIDESETKLVRDLECTFPYMEIEVEDAMDGFYEIYLDFKI